MYIYASGRFYVVCLGTSFPQLRQFYLLLIADQTQYVICWLLTIYPNAVVELQEALIALFAEIILTNNMGSRLIFFVWMNFSIHTQSNKANTFVQKCK